MAILCSWPVAHEVGSVDLSVFILDIITHGSILSKNRKACGILLFGHVKHGSKVWLLNSNFCME